MCTLSKLDKIISIDNDIVEILINYILIERVAMYQIFLIFYIS